MTDERETDTSLTHHDSQPYFLPSAPPIQPIDFSPHISATTWMKPLPAPAPPTNKTLVELPANWYMEDSESRILQYLCTFETNKSNSDTNAIPPCSTELPRLCSHEQYPLDVASSIRVFI